MAKQDKTENPGAIPEAKLGAFGRGMFRVGAVFSGLVGGLLTVTGVMGLLKPGHRGAGILNLGLAAFSTTMAAFSWNAAKDSKALDTAHKAQSPHTMPDGAGSYHRVAQDPVGQGAPSEAAGYAERMAQQKAAREAAPTGHART